MVFSRVYCVETDEGKHYGEVKYCLRLVLNTWSGVGLEGVFQRLVIRLPHNVIKKSDKKKIA